MRLDLFSQQRLHAALEDAGYRVSHRTVRRWVEGDAKPDAAWQRAILEVLGIQKEAAPHIGERLDDLVVLVRAIAGATPGIDLAAMDDIHRRVLELERARQRHGAPRRSEDQATRDEQLSSGQ